ncbi:A/G-specific adenine glycosylase [Desulfosporosinus sp. BICA1-9]|uniref:A/G-specific adenine glycosylase n=1 Tax=Desulfosporosinus sp. BICA1-9 TaxID=1531958 RepID=UPI0005F125D4|nr:A/G-specific adenine glycosylase [Desulfosporosinus sp. BICA1-9]KJS47136.1 MAG: adenine glycosylase [Peptococcaceae bacterium BRH_c23]KJS79796.1 MAG: adenine glycosylase [Desulfosporosinus sp. BICA1-9]HBW38183.1 A/G-specific adenine glycosylase [Desulfosporosinus sp.]
MTASYDSAKHIAQDQTISTRLLSWYGVEKRDLPWRRTGEPYGIWVSEVMLQQTQVKTVIPYYERFIQRFPGVEQLGTASLDDVLTIWSGLGYYSRARRMWEGANYLLKQLGGKMPRNYKNLLQIPGIGDYTAGAIASIAFGERVAAIDGNVKRVVSRLLAWSEPVETVRSYRHFRDQLMLWQPALQAGDFNQALMELGAMVCTPKKPDCVRCPLAESCQGYWQGDFLRYPVKKPKAQRQVVTRLTFVLRRGNTCYLQKRPSNGLLADLWEFPGVELSPDHFCELDDKLPASALGKCFALFQQSVPERTFDSLVRDQFEQGLRFDGPIWYTFSHRQWKMIWAIIDLPDCPDSLNLPEPLETGPSCAFSMKELDGEYSLDSRKINPLGERGCWVSINDLGGIPLPVAFTAIVERLTPRLKG